MNSNHSKQISEYLEKIQLCKKQRKRIYYTCHLFNYLNTYFHDIFSLYNIRFKKRETLCIFLKSCYHKCLQLKKDLMIRDNIEEIDTDVYNLIIELELFQNKYKNYYHHIQLHLQSKFSRDVTIEILQFL